MEGQWRKMLALPLAWSLLLLASLAKSDEVGHIRSRRRPKRSSRSLADTRNQLCPIDRRYPPHKYGIQPFPDDNPHDNVEDDLAEISSLGFASYTDVLGRKYAYVISDKEQFRLKVVRFNTNDDKTNNGPWTGSASVVAVYTLDVDTSNDDIEDLSVGPCSDADDSTTCIYLGNFGNNPRGAGSSYVPRHEVEVFKLPEPLFTGPDNTPVSQHLQVSTLQFQYDISSSGVTLDAEAMFVDWTGINGLGKGDVYIILKGRCGKGVQRLPVTVHKDLLPGEVVNVGNTDMVTEDPPWQQLYNCGDSEFDVWQGADMSRDGTRIAMITQGYPPRVYFFARANRMSVAEALLLPSCDYISSVSSGLLNERKYEAVAFVDERGTSIAETTECNGGRDCVVPMYFHELVFTESETKSTNGTSIPTEGWIGITNDDFADGSLGNFKTTRNGMLNVFPSQTAACEGQYSVHLGHGDGLSSSLFHASSHDCSLFSMLRVTFQSCRFVTSTCW